MTDAAKAVEARRVKTFYDNTECSTCNAPMYGKEAYGIPTHIEDAERIICGYCASRLAAVEEPAKPTVDEEEDASQCARCHATMNIPYPLKPTKYCHNCAQELVAEYEYKVAAPGDVRETDEFARLLDLYVRGFKPVDVARDLVEKYRTANPGRDIFDANPAYTDAQLLGDVREGVELPRLDLTKEDFKEGKRFAIECAADGKTTLREIAHAARTKKRERQLLVAIQQVAENFEDAKAYADAAKIQRERAERAESELSRLRSELKDMKTQLLSQLKRDDQMYETGKKIRDGELKGREK